MSTGQSIPLNRKQEKDAVKANNENGYSKEELLKVISENFCPPQSYLVFGFLHVLKWAPERIIKELYDKTLGEIVEIFEAELKADEEIPDNLISDCLKGIHASMTQTLDKIVSGKGFRIKYRNLLDNLVSEIILRRFYGHLDNIKLAEEWNSHQEIKWILKARGKNRSAFEKLYKAYENQIRGIVRIKVYNYEDAQDVVQKSALMLWEKGIKDYNPAFTHFSRYIKSQLRYIILNHLRERQNERIAVALPKQAPQIQQGQNVLDLNQPIPINPESHLYTKQIFELFANKVFSGKELPHKKLAFSFSKLLVMPPRVVVKNYTNTTLINLSNGFKMEYSKYAHISEEQLSGILAPMNKQLIVKFSEENFGARVFNAYNYIGVDFLKDSKFKDYYTQTTSPDSGTTPENNIAQWTDQIRGSVLSKISPSELEDLNIH